MSFNYFKCCFNNKFKIVTILYKTKEKVDSSAGNNAVVKMICNFRKIYMQWKPVCHKSGASAQDAHKPDLSS